KFKQVVEGAVGKARDVAGRVGRWGQKTLARVQAFVASVPGGVQFVVGMARGFVRTAVTERDREAARAAGRKVGELLRQVARGLTRGVVLTVDFVSALACEIGRDVLAGGRWLAPRVVTVGKAVAGGVVRFVRVAVPVVGAVAVAVGKGLWLVVKGVVAAV